MSNSDFNAPPDWGKGNDFNQPNFNQQNWGNPQQYFQQAPQPPKKKKHIGLKILFVVVVLVLITSAYSAGEDSKSPSDSKSSSTSKGISSSNSKSSSSTSKSSSSKDSSKAKGNKKELSVGDSFEESNLKMTVDNIQYDWKVPDSGNDVTDSLYKAKDGYTYVKMDVTMKNTGDSDVFSSSTDFKLYADNNPYDQEYGMDSYGVNPNGSDFSSLSAGRKASFSVFWQVPVRSKSVEIEYEPSFWSDKKVLIKVK